MSNANQKKQLKAIIISNIFVLALSFVMLATMSYAWFFSAWNVPVKQEMHVGLFKLNLTESTETPDSSTQLITISASYPSTFAQAKTAASSGKKVTYAFEIENIGTVTAQIRLFAQVYSDSCFGKADPLKPLSQQIRFAAKIYGKTDPEPDWTENGGLLFSPAGNPSNVSLKSFFNNKLLTGNDSSGYVAKDLGVVYSNKTPSSASNSKVFIKLLFWLDKDSTIQSTGATLLPAGETPTFKFSISVSAIQQGGEVSFPSADVGYIPDEQKPKGVTP